MRVFQMQLQGVEPEVKGDQDNSIQTKDNKRYTKISNRSSFSQRVVSYQNPVDEPMGLPKISINELPENQSKSADDVQNNDKSAQVNSKLDEEELQLTPEMIQMRELFKKYLIHRHKIAEEKRHQAMKNSRRYEIEWGPIQLEIDRQKQRGTKIDCSIF